ncbi:MAG: DUF1538 domain-containing protein [Chromatiaceae bacterium]|nr:DUF1538 domain-containing protein [Chromatiaceae bacterium]
MEKLKLLLTPLLASARDLLPIVVVISFFQFLVLRQPIPNLAEILLGTLFVSIGLALFVRGLEIGLFPIGESMAYAFARKGSLSWLLLFAFALGFGTTVAEPALIAVAAEAAEVAAVGQMIDDTPAAKESYADGLRITVALSVGFAILVGVLRIIRGWPVHYLIIGSYIGVIVMTGFAPPEIIGIAYDSGGVTTSTITVPLVTALGVGLASSIKGRNPMIDGFGLIAFASLTPMIFVMGYGIFGVGDNAQKLDGPFGVFFRGTVQQIESLLLVGFGPIGDAFQGMIAPVKNLLLALPGKLGGLFHTLFDTVADVLPITLIIFGFQLGALRRPIPHMGRVLAGFGYVLIGLAFFLDGLELALFPLGKLMAQQLTDPAFIANVTHHITAFGWWDYRWVYLFGFAIGFSTTIAEPSLLAVAIKANQVSAGSIGVLGLRVAVALGVAIGIALGTFRIVSGTPLHWYIIAGYVIVVIQTFFAPRLIIALAYDSGGVTTSTVTVPLVAALGLGLASTVPGRSALLDGFGLIAFASLFPMMTVMAYAQLSEWRSQRTNRSN